MNTSSTFGQWLKQRRRTLGLTQGEVAQATYCSRDTIRKIEAGLRNPSPQIAELLAGFLEIEPADRDTFIKWARGVAQAPLSTLLTLEVGSPDSPPAEPPTPPALPLPPTRHLRSSSLPLLPTPLLGREQTLAHARSLLWLSTTRLLTLLGPPGIGKTSLGIAIASSLQNDFKDGVTYVPLAPVSGHALVTATIAEELGVRETSHSTLHDSLIDLLHDKQMLLVLDNFEHVTEAAPLLADLLTASPQLKILVTSRSPLHLRGERLVRVPTLPVPDPSRHLSLHELSRIGSISLFVERVRDANINFELTTENAPTVAAICARLDGLPLALELAAARTRMLSLPSLLSRLQTQSGQLSVLTGGPRDAPTHHRALRTALESSYALLNADEQRLFRRLGIFAGPFTLDEAEGVANATLDTLAAVLDHSLIHMRNQADPANYTRNEAFYTMLVPVREFALEQLDIAGERQATALAHALYFLDLARVAGQEMTGQNQKFWMDFIGDIYGDFRSAMDWALNNDHVEMTLLIAARIRHFWLRRGSRHEGLYWLEQAVTHSGNAPAEARVEGLTALSGLLRRYGAIKEAERHIAEAVILARQQDDKLLSITPLILWGLVLTDLGEFERAEQALQDCLSISKGSDDKFSVSKVLVAMSRNLSYQRDFAGAIDLLEQALAITRQLDIPTELAIQLQNLGVIALKQGDYSRAIKYAEESSAFGAQTGDKNNMTYSLGVLGKAYLKLGHYERAAISFNKCLSMFVELGAMGMVAFVLEELGRVAIGMKQPAKAARLFGVAEALRESVGASVDPPDRPERDESIAALHQLLNESEFNAAWSVGRSMPLEDAISFAKSLAGN